MPFIPIIIGLGIMISAGPIFGMVGSMLLFNTMLGIGLSLTLGGIEKAIRGSPKMSSLSSSALDRKVSIRQPLADGRVIYGAASVGGVITYLESTGTNNEFLHIVLTLCAHELAAIGTMYFDNVAVPVDGSGNATGTYAGLVHIEKNLGTRDQAAFSGLISSSAGKWTSAHRQRGRAGVYVRLKYDQNKFPNGVPNITFDVTGRPVRNLSGAIVTNSNSALAINDYLLDSNFGLGAIRKIPIDSSFVTQSGLGSFNAGNVVDGDVANSCFQTDTAVAGSTLNFDLGTPYEPVELRIFMLAAPSAANWSLQYSDNASTYTTALASIIPDGGKLGVPNKFRVPMVGAHRYWRLYLNNTPGPGTNTAEVQLYESMVDRTQLADAMTTCDEAVTLAAGGSEARYSTDGAFESSERPADALTALAGAMAGYVHYTGGKFFLFPGKWRAPAGGSMATVNVVKAALGTATSSPTTCTFTGGNTNGNANVIEIVERGTTSLHVTSVTDGEGNAYVMLFSTNGLCGGQNEWHSWWLAPVTGGSGSNNTVSVAWSAGPSRVTIAGVECSGVDLDSPLDATANLAAPNNGTSVSYTLTANYAGSLILTMNTRLAGGVNWSGLSGTDLLGVTSVQTEHNWFTSAAGANSITATASSSAFGTTSIAIKAAVNSAVLTEDDVVGQMKVTPRVSRREIYNTIRGTFISAAAKWQPTNFPAVSNPLYVSEDGGDVIFLDAELPFTISNARAQRISKIALNRARRQMILETSFKLSSYKSQVCDVVKITNSRFGWVEKTFEVKTMQLSSDVNEDEGSIVLFVNAMLRETDSNVYDWNPANDELTPSGASPIAIADLRTAAPVTNLAAGSHENVAKDGARALVVELTWDAPADQHVLQGGLIHVYWRLHTSSGWTEAATLAGTSTGFELNNLTSGVAYDYNVVTENTVHVRSVDTILSNVIKNVTVSGMLTYRPLSNPLTAHDAGSNVTISIASFTMRVQGIGDISINSGALTGKSYNTLYYVYYDDPTLAGGSVSYDATTVKENALIGAGRMFVGSIVTPAAGNPDTVGNSDGGSGAQAGMLNTYFLSTATFDVISNGGNGTKTNEADIIDGNFGTAATYTVTGNSSVANTANTSLHFKTLPLVRRPNSIKIKVFYEVPTNGLNGTATGRAIVQVKYVDTGGALQTVNLAVVLPGVTVAKTILSTDVPVGASLYIVNCSVQTEASDTTGTLTMKVYEAWIEVID